jgi:hypothetical protein
MPRVYSATSRFCFCHPRGYRLSRKRIVVRAVLPLSRMAAFGIQNAAMRDNRCRDMILIAVFPDHTMRSRLHHRFVMLCQCSPAYIMRSAPLSTSSLPSTPREARYHRRHGNVGGSPAAAISSRRRSKPRKLATIYKMPSIFDADPKLHMEIESHADAQYALSAVPRHRPQHIARSRRRALAFLCIASQRTFLVV